MGQDAEVERDQLLALLRGEGVRLSRTQLLRWQHAGAFPRPRHKGLGRGRGKKFLYPGYATVQALVMARALREKRNLDDAAWTAWVIGFPLTRYVRELLLEELRLTARGFREEHRRLVRDDQRSALIRAARGRIPGLERMRQVLRPESLTVALRIVAEQQLGILDVNRYTEDDWRRLQDAVVTELMPAVDGDPALPDPAQIARGYQELSDKQSLSKLAAALKKIEARFLEIIRNEAQALHERLAQTLGVEPGLIAREEFLRYFASRYLNPPPREQMTAFLKALGWHRPPDSPLVRMWRQQHPVAESAAPALPGQTGARS